MAGQFGDTQSDIKNLYEKVDGIQNALEKLAEAMHESARQHAELLIYQRQHDKATERTGARLEKVEDAQNGQERKINKLSNIGYTVWIIFGGILAFSSNYVVSGIASVVKELHEHDKRLNRIEYALGKDAGGGIKASIKCAGDMDDCNPQPKPAPKPDVIVTNDGV